MTTRKYTKTCKDTITPRTQEEVPDILGELLPQAKKHRVNGSIVISISQGGVRNIVVENIEEVAKQ